MSVDSPGMTFTTRKLKEDKPSVAEQVLKKAPFLVRAGNVFSAMLSLSRKRTEEEMKAKKRTTLLKRLALILVGTFAVVMLFAGTVKALVSLKVITPSTLFHVAGSDLPTDSDGFTNFLLLGTGDETHQGTDLTDTIMIASIDPKTRSALLFSIPRDLYITESDKMGTGRINELYRNYKYYLLRNEDMEAPEASKEALNELARELGSKLGLTLHRVIKVDFTGFVDVVDALGGIDIEVPRDIVDTQYPGPNYSYETFSIEAGPQHLDGETALKYARSRHSTSDFDRSARQQQIMHAIAKKAQEEGVISSPGKIMSLLKILSENVESTMTVSEMIGTGKLAERIDRSNLISMHLNDRSGLYEPGGFIGAAPRDQFGGAAVLLPLAYEGGPGGSWGEIRTFVYLLTHYRATYLNRPRIHILNDGAPAGVARRLADELGRYGFMVAETGNATADGKAPADADKRETSGIAPLAPENEDSAEFLSALLNMPVTTVPTDLLPEQLGQVTVFLGKDYTFKDIRTLVPVPEPVATPSSASGSLTSPLEESGL